MSHDTTAQGDTRLTRLRRAAQYAARYAEHRQRNERVPGIVIAMAAHDELLVEAAFGHADLDGDVPMQPHHRFRIASQSKVFTAVAILQLVEQGRLRLDDPIGDHLPALVPDPGAPAGTPARVTIRHLLSHTGGISRDGRDAGHWQLTRDFSTRDGLLAEAAEIPPPLPTDTRFKYSNVGFALLGQVVEAVTAQTFADHVARTILEPLSLQATSPELPDDAWEGLARGHARDHYGIGRVALPHASSHGMQPAGGFVSTAADMCRFGAALCLGDDSLLSDATKRLMQHPAWEIIGAGAHYGLGVEVQVNGSRRLIGHGGAFPGYRTALVVDPHEGLTVSVMINAIDVPAKSFADAAMSLLHLALEDRPSSSNDAVGHARFEGRFHDPWGVLDIVAVGGRLLGVFPDAVKPLEDVIEFDVVDDRTLRIAEANGYGSPGELVTFEFTTDGNIRHIVHAGSLMHPWETYATAFPFAVPSSTN